MIKVKCTGDFSKTEKFLMGMNRLTLTDVLHKYGKEGVSRLRDATPVDSGNTANSWDYEISTGKQGGSITWINTAKADNVPIVILIQYGHATGNGGYVSGVDFINPALKSLFDRLSQQIWKEVCSL